MSTQKAKSQLTWDPYVRIFHWALVGFFFLAYWLEGGWLNLHSHAGYTVTLLLVFRLVWGFVGTVHARFSDFLVGPLQSLRYLGGILRGQSVRYVGHDPAGAAMIFLLFGSILMTTLSGMSLFAMEGYGPFSDVFADSFLTPFLASWQGGIVEDVHDFFANLTVVLVVLHVLGVLGTSWQHRENLIAAMLTGRKKP